MISKRIRQLREAAGMSQSELAKKLNVTRASVNSWESGLSTPTTQYVIALVKLFRVSADYLLGTEPEFSLCLNGYSSEEIRLLTELAEHFARNHQKKTP